MKSIRYRDSTIYVFLKPRSQLRLSIFLKNFQPKFELPLLSVSMLIKSQLVKQLFMLLFLIFLKHFQLKFYQPQLKQQLLISSVLPQFKVLMLLIQQLV